MPEQPHSSSRMRFGLFELDVRSRTLWRNGARLNVPEQPLTVLSALLERPGDVVTRDQLRRRLWADDTFVDFEHGLNAAVKRLRHVLADSADEPRYIETIPRRGYRFIGPCTPGADGPGRARVNSLAVLPLLNRSGDPEQEYVADGLTDALINELARIDGVRVISRTSAMLYRGTRKTVAEIARELQVDAIVEGSVLRFGDQLRVSAQLVHAATDAHLWACSYDGSMRDVFMAQNDVAEAIARAIEIKVTGLPRQRGAAPTAIDSRAQEAYLKGRHHWSKATEQGLWKAVEYLRVAVGITPGFAAAHVALADVHVALAALGAQTAQEAFTAAEREAHTALDLDPTLSDAHRAAALVHMFYRWDWARAEEAFGLALRGTGGFAETHWQHALLLLARGRCEEAVTEAEHARSLDPLSLMINNDLGFALWAARRFDGAIDQYRRTLELDANFAESRRELGLLYAETGEIDAAVDELNRAVVLARDPESLAYLGYGLAIAGRRDEAECLLAELDLLSKVRYVSPVTYAVVHTGLEDCDAAFTALNRACQDRSPSVIFVSAWPLFDRLRSDRRYDTLMRRLSLASN
jgi:TolB-like protein/DNA-binding winged helix-turn-helix (wHTH) protein/Flp pilus assembly protein TadD